jgi:hypothetical protein
MGVGYTSGEGCGMPATTQSGLDDFARMEYTEERERHLAALRAIRPGDADDIAAEFNRHLSGLP